MSQTLSELELHTPPLDTARPRRRAWSRWAKWFVCLLIFLWLAGRGVSLLIRHTRLQRRLTARLGTVFGRSVEVGSYDFSLWGGPTLQAHAVTFGEDPRFGHEYFLRADSLAKVVPRTHGIGRDRGGKSQPQSGAQFWRRLERRGVVAEIGGRRAVVFFAGCCGALRTH